MLQKYYKNITEMLQKYYKIVTKMLQIYYKVLQNSSNCGIIYVYSKEKVRKMIIIKIIYLLTIVIVALIGYAVIQLRLIGLNIKDFWTFIEANQILDKLYNFSTRYSNLTSQEQIIFMQEAEKVFNAFDKVPTQIWEEEYRKYQKVLEVYRNIKMDRWATA